MGNPINRKPSPVSFNRRLSVFLAGLFCFVEITQAQVSCLPKKTRPDTRYENAVANGSEVRDKVTGLIWQRCPSGQTWNGSTCYGIAKEISSALVALEVATAANADSGAGKTWRLPNVIELLSLTEISCYRPSINTKWFPRWWDRGGEYDLPAVDNAFWSSTPNSKEPGDFFMVGFDFSNIPFRRFGYVRLVRSGP